jgi:hypothetical protein
LTFRVRLTLDVERVCPDLSHASRSRAGDRLDQVVLVPDLDRGVIDEDVADREHLVVDRDHAVGSDPPKHPLPVPVIVGIDGHRDGVGGVGANRNRSAGAAISSAWCGRLVL